MTERDYPLRCCPACGWNGLEGPLPVMWSRPRAEMCAFTELRSSWRGFFQERKSFFSYVRCPECGQIYSPRYFTPSQLAELYGQMDDNTAGQDEAMLARAQRGYWKLLTRFASPPAGAYVELGPDIGLFTREALAHRALDPFWLIEPNRTVHPALDRLLGERPHTILADLEQTGEIPDGTASLVVAIHVLDHLLEPQKMLDRLTRKLRSGGVLFAVTHNADSPAARVFGERWPAYCLQHPQLYSPQTLRQSYERAGLREVRIKRTTNYFPLGYLLRHLFFAARLGRVEIPLPASWIVGLKLGNIAALGVKG